LKTFFNKLRVSFRLSWAEGGGGMSAILETTSLAS
jgi:hypothetical protein